MQKKQELRKTMLAQRAALIAAEKTAYDQSIGKHLAELVEARKAQSIHIFLPMGDEMNLYPFIEKMLEDGRRLITPKTLKNRQLEHRILFSLEALEAGVFGTKHPEKAEIFKGKYDLIIVPGLAFDANGWRLGYGGGYYDTFLADHLYAYKIGLAYPFQMVDFVPHEAHDVRLDGVLVVDR